MSWRKLGILEPTTGRVLFRDTGLADTIERPLDRQRRVVPAKASLAFTIVVGGDLVKHVRGVGEDHESVRESLRNPEKLEIFSAKRDTRPLAEIRRVAPQIDRHIPDVPGKHANQLSLLLAQLVVQP